MIARDARDALHRVHPSRGAEVELFTAPPETRLNPGSHETSPGIPYPLDKPDWATMEPWVVGRNPPECTSTELPSPRTKDRGLAQRGPQARTPILQVAPTRNSQAFSTIPISSVPPTHAATASFPPGALPSAHTIAGWTQSTFPDPAAAEHLQSMPPVQYLQGHGLQCATLLASHLPQAPSMQGDPTGWNPEGVFEQLQKFFGAPLASKEEALRFYHAAFGSPIDQSAFLDVSQTAIPARCAATSLARPDGLTAASPKPDSLRKPIASLPPRPPTRR
ncbi:hypothetical protein C8Q77DRAFT_221704 [Trametes polyzona]|nr:hypothetical protein C8Q77DRAFT_221704 [Trametes polyzona]